MNRKDRKISLGTRSAFVLFALFLTNSAHSEICRPLLQEIDLSTLSEGWKEAARSGKWQSRVSVYANEPDFKSFYENVTGVLKSLKPGEKVSIPYSVNDLYSLTAEVTVSKNGVWKILFDITAIQEGSELAVMDLKKMEVALVDRLFAGVDGKMLSELKLEWRTHGRTGDLAANLADLEKSIFNPLKVKCGGRDYLQIAIIAPFAGFGSYYITYMMYGQSVPPWDKTTKTAVAATTTLGAGMGYLMFCKRGTNGSKDFLFKRLPGVL